MKLIHAVIVVDVVGAKARVILAPQSMQERKRALARPHAELGDVIALLREKRKHRQMLVDVGRLANRVLIRGSQRDGVGLV